MKQKESDTRRIFYGVVATIAIIIAGFFIVRGMNPEFFDIFGLVVFIFLLGVGFWILKYRKKFPRWIAFIIVLIGLLGLVVDGYIVIKTYLIGG